MNEFQIPKRMIASAVIGLIAIIGAFAIGGNAVEEVKKGDFQVRQRWGTGTLAVKTTPGMWSQFGYVETFPKSETFYFTSDKYEGEDYDQSIKIQFADGSWADASGTARIVMPTTEKDIIRLVRDLNYESYEAVQDKLVLPVIRRALNATAKLMTARESYSEKYNEYIFHAIYQIEHGLYVTKPVSKKITDPLSGEEVTATFQEIQYDENDQPLTQSNPLDGTGVVVLNFEIKGFEYDDVVMEQIAKQQTAMMAVATKKLEAQEAEQEKLRVAAVGKANVEKARYEKEVEKIEAVTTAEKLKAVAELKAQQELEVAKLAKAAAAETKAKDILLGQGEAERKRLVMSADGALAQKLATYEKVQAEWAKAVATYNGNWVPSTVMGSSGTAGTNGAQTLVDLLTAKTAKDLQLDLSVQGTK